MCADATPIAADAPRELKRHMGFVPWLELAANQSFFAFIGGNRRGIGGHRRSLNRSGFVPRFDLDSITPGFYRRQIGVP